MANKKHIRIRDLRDAKKLLVKLVNERYRGEIDSDTARDCGFLIRIFAELHYKADIEERLGQLEKLVIERQHERGYTNGRA